MKKIENTLRQIKLNYPKSLKKFWPGYLNHNGIPERNLTFQFVNEYLKGNKKAHAYFEVPFGCKTNKKNKVLHYDAIIVDSPSLIIIEAKRVHNKGTACGVGKDVTKIQNHYKKVRDNINCKIDMTYGLVLAEAWSKKNIESKDGNYPILNWWAGSSYIGKYDNWKGICKMDKGSWECGSISIDYSKDIEPEEGDNSILHILYGYRDLL